MLEKLQHKPPRVSVTQKTATAESIKEEVEISYRVSGVTDSNTVTNNRITVALPGGWEAAYANDGDPANDALRVLALLLMLMAG